MRDTHAIDRARGQPNGFTLIEAVVATAIMTVAVLSVAQLLAICIRANQDAAETSLAALLAGEKLEQLRALTWGFDAGGLPLSDTSSDLSSMPERPDGGFGLLPSPWRSLQRNAAGYCDFLDARGLQISGGATPPPGTVYVRRWAIDPLPVSPNDTVVLQVLVTRWRNRGVADSDRADQSSLRLPGEARLVSVKTRKAA